MAFDFGAKAIFKMDTKTITERTADAAASHIMSN
jgi:hypothetical protein